MFRLVAFGLELFITALRRNRFRDAAILARLDSMIVRVVENTRYSMSAPVLVLGIKAAAGIVSYPLKSLEKSVPFFRATNHRYHETSRKCRVRSGPGRLEITSQHDETEFEFTGVRDRVA